jgi:hypothetical protein
MQSQAAPKVLIGRMISREKARGFSEPGAGKKAGPGRAGRAAAQALPFGACRVAAFQ